MTIQELLDKLQRLLKDNRIVEDDLVYIGVELTPATNILIPEGKVIIT